MREICPRVTSIRQRCSRAVNSRQPRAHKQLVQVASVCRDDDCVISPNRAAAKGTPPTRVNRERLCERLFCELACLAANLDGCIRANAEICCLFCDAVCVNSLFFWRVYKVEPKNQLFLVWQDDVEGIPVVPPLWLIGAACANASSGTSNAAKIETRTVTDSSKDQPAIAAEPGELSCVKV
jgi:hypothetical protein